MVQTLVLKLHHMCVSRREEDYSDDDTDSPAIELSPDTHDEQDDDHR